MPSINSVVIRLIFGMCIIGLLHQWGYSAYYTNLDNKMGWLATGLLIIMMFSISMFLCSLRA